MNWYIFKLRTMLDEPSNQLVSYHVRCECKHCQHCIKEATIYDECEGCYEGKHPCLPRISWDFENHLKKLTQLTFRRESN